MRMQESVALDQAQGLGKRNFAVKAMPLAGVAKVGKVETITGDVLWVSKDATPRVHRPRVLIASHLRPRHRMRGTEYRARARRAACIGRRRERHA